MGKLRSFLFEVLQTVALALGIFAIVYFFLLQPHQVRGRSMEPNFLDGEYLLTEKISYRIRDPKRGEVVVFAAPPTHQQDFIKRIIGLPNETIVLKNGTIFINGQELRESYISSTITTTEGKFLPEGQQITLGEEEYFVLGDNREHSSDSRVWGTINKEDIVGKAWFIYWPLPVVGVIPSISSADFF